MAERFGNDLVLAEKLAAGGMAEVYRAIQFGHGGFEKVIALKRILPHYAADDEFKHMFQMEANLSGLLQHPNIVTIYTNGEWEGYLYLLMEFVDGKNVRQLLARADKKRIKIPVQFSCYLVAEACKGLEYAHNFADPKTGEPLNIVHRDMSPQNIMLSYDGASKIVDFGIAKAAARSENTRAGILKGKFGYMSPEQAQGMPLDKRTDVFAMGIILFELLTQRRLFSHDDDMRTLQLVRDCKVPRPSSYNPDVGPTLDRIVLQALAKNKAERYANAADMYADLIRFMNSRYPEFIPTDFSKFLRKIFESDIADEKKRREKIAAEMPARLGSANTAAQKNDKKVKIRDEDSTNLEELGDGTGLTSKDLEGLEALGGGVLTLKGGSLASGSAHDDSSLPPSQDSSDANSNEKKVASANSSHLSLTLPSGKSQSTNLAFKSHNSLQMSKVAQPAAGSAPDEKKAALNDARGLNPAPSGKRIASAVSVTLTPQGKKGGSGVYRPTGTNNGSYRAASSVTSTPAARPSIGRSTSSSAGTFLTIALVVILGGGAFWQFSLNSGKNSSNPVCKAGEQVDDSGNCIAGVNKESETCLNGEVLDGGRCIASVPQEAPLYIPPSDNAGVLKFNAYPPLTVKEIRVGKRILADKSGKKISGTIRSVDMGAGTHTIEIIGSPFPKTWKGEVTIKPAVITPIDVELQ